MEKAWFENILCLAMINKKSKEYQISYFYFKALQLPCHLRNPIVMKKKTLQRIRKQQTNKQMFGGNEFVQFLPEHSLNWAFPQKKNASIFERSVELRTNKQ